MIAEFEKDVLRAEAGLPVRDLVPGAAQNEAREMLKSSGYLNYYGNLSAKGIAAILDDRAAVLLQSCRGKRGSAFVMAAGEARDRLGSMGLAVARSNGAWALTDLGYDVREVFDHRGGA